MRANVLMVASAICIAVCLAASSVCAADLPIRVIVHPTRAGGLTVAEVRAIFLKEQRLWSDGQPIVPVNREAGSAAREAFSRRVFGRGSRQMASYWNRRYFDDGDFPPATLASEEAVLRFVAANVNAVGYVVAAEISDAVVVILELGAEDRGSAD
jgi:ABC-type phosphate transport system substrate-binding protein